MLVYQRVNNMIMTNKGAGYNDRMLNMNTLCRNYYGNCKYAIIKSRHARNNTSSINHKYRLNYITLYNNTKSTFIFLTNSRCISLTMGNLMCLLNKKQSSVSGCVSSPDESHQPLGQHDEIQTWRSR